MATKDGAKTIIESLERESDMMPNTSPLNELRKFVKKRGIDSMSEFPMGRRAGKRGKREIILSYKEKGGMYIL